MRNEAALENAKETAERMIRDNEISLEKIARYVPLLSMEDLKEIEAKLRLFSFRRFSELERKWHCGIIWLKK